MLQVILLAVVLYALYKVVGVMRKSKRQDAIKEEGEGADNFAGDYGAKQFMNIMTMDAAKRLSYEREMRK